MNPKALQAIVSSNLTSPTIFPASNPKLTMGLMFLGGCLATDNGSMCETIS